MSEKRCYERIHKQIRIRWKNEKVSIDGITLDICPGGVFIVTSEVPPPKSIIDVELWLGEEECAVHCRGEVVWVNNGQLVYYPPGFGVQFLDLAESSLDHLLATCEGHEKCW